MCALHCEAKPVIDFYKLKKSSNKNDFDVYKSKDIACIVSGMGADNMTRAVSWVNSQFNLNNNLCWINLGVAGQHSMATGTTVLISQARQHDNNESILKITGIKHDFESLPVISLSSEKTDYDEKALFDMEAYAFFQTTRKFCAEELCQSIKVISDNRVTPPTRDKAKISALIAQNMVSISVFALKLQEQIH